MSTNAVDFFYEHAGWSYDPLTETPEQGRRRCAEYLALAEKWADEHDIEYLWFVDPDCDSSSFTDETPSWPLWQCNAYDGDKVVTALCGIDFGRDGDPWNDPYKRVVEAELAQEAMS